MHPKHQEEEVTTPNRHNKIRDYRKPAFYSHTYVINLVNKDINIRSFESSEKIQKTESGPFYMLAFKVGTQ